MRCSWRGCGKNLAVLPAHRGLDFDLGQILLMDLALRAASHPLALCESGEASGGALLGGVLGPFQPAPPAVGVVGEQALLSPAAARGAGMGRWARLSAGGVMGQGRGEPSFGGRVDHRWAFTPCCPCLLAPHVPGDLSATVAAPPHHGWSRNPASGGPCPLPAGPGSAGQQALCAWAPLDRRPHCMVRGQPSTGRHQG